MAVATISVNFATAAQVFTGTSTIVSINPFQLKSALTSGTSMYNLDVRGAKFNDNVTIASGFLQCTDSTKVNFFAGTLEIQNTTEAVSDGSVYAFKVGGGIYVTKKSFLVGAVTVSAGLTVNGAQLLVTQPATIQGVTAITSTTASTNYANGALVVSGGVGIAGKLFVNDSMNVLGISCSGVLDLTSTTNTIATLTVAATTPSTSKTTGAVTIAGGVGISGSINVGGDVTAYATSDRTLKTNVVNITNPLAKVNAINGVTFEWNELSDKQGADVGLIAQEVEQVLPEIVTTREDGTKALRYEKVVPLLVEAIKELQRKVERLENKGS